MSKTNIKKTLSTEQCETLLFTLNTRFENNKHRHKDIKWIQIQEKLVAHTEKLWSLNEMEKTDGEPDVVLYDNQMDVYIFYDCSRESPAGRRSICYDNAAQEARKTFKPETNAIDMATAMGIEILTEAQYRMLQKLGSFDTKTSSWVKTPTDIRKLGGALFADYRYGHVFFYHNSAASYYSSRGFRGSLSV